MRDDDDPAARVSAFSAAELRTSAEATTRGRADSDDSDAERATAPWDAPWDADNRARPHPPFGLTRAERAYFDAAGSPMRARTTTYGSIAVDVADAGDDDDEEEEEEEGDRARDAAAGARSSGWLGTSGRRRGATVAAAACLAMCGVGALALAIAPPEIRAGVASSLGLRIPESPKPGFVEANRHEPSTSFLAPLGSNDDANDDDGDASHGPLRAPSSSSSFEPRRNGYLVGLTTSAGFGDQFKRLSTYASMARELDRTLVLWPVWTSPHYDLDGGRDTSLGPLRFSDYVMVHDGDATDVANRVVRYEDAPAQVRDFPRRHGKACVTSNNLGNPVQFLTSANLSEAIVAEPDGSSFKSFEALRDDLRRHARHGPEPLETVCLAATFSPRDYNNPRHAETANAWAGLDFKPKPRYHKLWSNAVNAMAIDAGEPGAGLAAGLGEDPEKAFKERLPEYPMRVTGKYAALHWRRGDKCGKSVGVQRTRREGPNGGFRNGENSQAHLAGALKCEDYEADEIVTRMCRELRPMYVATDDDDPAFLNHLSGKGCYLSRDLRLGVPRDKLNDVDLLMIDVMMVAGAKESFTFGHTALARLYDRMRMSRGEKRSTNVANDHERFSGKFERPVVEAAIGKFSEYRRST